MYEYCFNRKDGVWDVFDPKGDYIKSFFSEKEAKEYCEGKNIWDTGW
jgi:hypothetical protein